MAGSKTEPLPIVGQTGGNYYDKYGSRNPIVRRLMSGYFEAFDQLVEKTGAQSIHEIGCGEGDLSIRLAQKGANVRACDVSDDVVDEARQNVMAAGVNVALATADIYGLSPDQDRAELIVCCEVLEHLDEPEKALDMLCSLAAPYLLISVPREPLWRAMNMARGRYWGDWGNTPGHVQNWSTSELVKLVESRVTIDEVLTPVPWTFLLCRSTK